MKRERRVQSASNQQQSDCDELEPEGQKGKSRLYNQVCAKRVSMSALLARLGALPLVNPKRLLLDIVPKVDFPRTKENARDLFEAVSSKLLTNKKLRKNWSSNEIGLLFFVLQATCYLENKGMGEFTNEDWVAVGDYLPGRTGLQAMYKWLTFRKFDLLNYPWTEEEEHIMRRLVGDGSRTNWLEVSQQLYSQGTGEGRAYRSAKQCREHWTCHLQEGLKKGYWNLEEDLQLVNEFLRLGKRWFQISRIMNSRTQNSIKNRFTLLLDKHWRPGQHEGQTMERVATQLRAEISCRSRPESKDHESSAGPVTGSQAEPTKQRDFSESVKVESSLDCSRVLQSRMAESRWGRLSLLGSQNLLSEMEVFCDGFSSMSLSNFTQEIAIQRVQISELQGATSQNGLLECVLDLDSMVIFHNNLRIERKQFRSTSIISMLSDDQFKGRSGKRSDSVVSNPVPVVFSCKPLLGKHRTYHMPMDEMKEPEMMPFELQRRKTYFRAVPETQDPVIFKEEGES